MISPEKYDEKRTQYILDHRGEKVEETGEEETSEKLGEDFDESIRKNHSLQSAIHVLEHREKLEAMGLNPDEIALGCFLHSKSCSGISNLADDGPVWKTSVEKIERAVKDYNKEHSEASIIFDRGCVFCPDGETADEEKLARMRSYGACLRVGDAYGHDYQSVETQGGAHIEVGKKNLFESPDEPQKKAREEELRQQIEGTYKDKTYEHLRLPYYQEVQGVKISVDGVELNNENDPKGVSRMYAAGEKNFRELKVEAKDNHGKPELVHSYTLVDGNDAVYCTQECLEERIKELNTICIEKSPEGKKPNKLNKINMKVVIHIGKASSDRSVRKSYMKYAADIREKYNIKMEIQE